MPHLLYDLAVGEDPDRHPIEALQSAVHWMEALTFELSRQFPEPTANQYVACQRFLQTRHQTGTGQLALARVYEPLYHSLLNAMSLCSIAQSCAGQSWVYGNAIVWWYYAYYHAFRSMLSAHGHAETKTHAGLIKALSPTLGSRLPHPLNMGATRVRGETYKACLPDAPEVTGTNLLDGPVADPLTAQAMLIGYLNGTATWHCEKVKEEIRARRPDIREFRTREARELRDSRLPNSLNFLHCAYRYRTKANYRDPLFLPYGQREIVPTDSFLENLAKTARFAFVFGLAYLERRLGPTGARTFIADLRLNVRNQDKATGQTSFWRDVPL